MSAVTSWRARQLLAETVAARPVLDVDGMIDLVREMRISVQNDLAAIKEAPLTEAELAASERLMKFDISINALFTQTVLVGQLTLVQTDTFWSLRPEWHGTFEELVATAKVL